MDGALEDIFSLRVAHWRESRREQILQILLVQQRALVRHRR